MKRLKRLHSLLLVLGTVCVAGMLLPAARAQDAKPGCDPEFMDAMEAKAYLGVQRRITQNQNLIVKPDSVLEYSCFNRQLDWLASNKGRRFSENTPAYPSWGNVTAVNDKTTDLALFEVVTKPLTSYLGSNFSHTFLGGRMVDPAGSPPAAGAFDCQVMKAVWTAARCIDFMEDDSKKYTTGDDGFYDFPWYKSNDPRRLPALYAACKSPKNLNDAIVNSYKASGDDSGQEYKLFVEEAENDPAIDDNKKYEEDPITVEDITDKMIPGECGDSLKIPTGVKVAVPGRSPEEYDETVCLTPGCSYTGKDCSFD